jgi:exosortase B
MISDMPLRAVWSRRVPLELGRMFPLIIGLVAIYAPTLLGLLTGIWSEEGQMHGPIVLCIAIWLLVRNWSAMETAGHKNAANPAGWVFIVAGLLIYIVGRSQGVLVLEVGSVIWILLGLILVQHGTAALKVQWFALFFMLFMVPLPSQIVDMVTMPMKMAVSFVAEHILFWAGYPISRSGVILQIGQYMLLVADACAGLHTLLTLEALGLLYLNLVQRDSVVRNVGLAILIVPISFTANVIRVMTLTLITYHFGDAAGQGFLHGFAGIVLFLTALMLIISIDGLLHMFEHMHTRLVSSGPLT